MTKLEKFYDDLQSMNIAVKNFQFSEHKKAACVAFGDNRAIALDRAAIASQAEELVVLGEECSHYETGTLRLISWDYNSVQNQINRVADEGRAHRHKIKKLVPVDELEEHIKNCTYADGLDVYELAELLEVTVEMLNQSLEYYAALGYQLMGELEVQ